MENEDFLIDDEIEVARKKLNDLLAKKMAMQSESGGYYSVKDLPKDYERPVQTFEVTSSMTIAGGARL
jgi:hypothetical protein